MLNRLRRKAILLVAILFLGITAHHYRSRLFFGLPKEFSPSGFAASDREVRELMHFSNYKFSRSDEFRQAVGGWDVFGAKSQTDKCDAFFTFIQEKMPEWKASMFRNRIYNKNVVNKAGYFSDNHGRVVKQRKAAHDSDPDVLTNADRQELDSWYADTLKSTLETEQEMADTMSILRQFGHCFFRPSSVRSNKLDTLFNQFAPRVLPYFKQELPQVFQSVGENSFFRDAPEFTKDSEFVDYYYNNMQGTGIVVSASTRHVRDLVKLIHILRALGNKLPIQIMYRRDISSSAKVALQQAASAPKEELFSPSHTETKALQESLKNAGIDLETLQKREFPPQDLALVDTFEALTPMDRSEFSGYNNKIAALFFTSFERVMLLDADVIPLSPPKALFEMKEYIETGAYFFKDRTLLDRNGWVETNFFSKLMPHESSSLDMVMGVKPVTNHTMRNEYMQGWRHCQEAGVVMLDRKAHFSSLLILLTLSLWGEPSKSSVWGDKELYWLAMSIAGDEQYTFNTYSAASVGEFTNQQAMKQYNTTNSLELCSSHPGHISSKGELLWINSGFAYCKMNGFMRDRTKFPHTLFEDPEAVRHIYESPLKIRHAIVPPSIPALRAFNGPADQQMEKAFLKSLKQRKKDVDDIPDVSQLGDYGPQKGWVKSPLCSNYQYCAYNEVSSLHNSKDPDQGSVFEFDSASTKEFDILGALWTAAKRYSDKSKNKTTKPKPKAEQPAVQKEAKEDDFDPSQVHERPEKLNFEIKGILEKLKSSL